MSERVEGAASAGEGNVEFVPGLIEGVEDADKQQLLARYEEMSNGRWRSSTEVDSSGG